MCKEIKKILESLLQYEGGEMQSMSEQVNNSIFNDRIISKAIELDIKLDTSGLGRVNYKPINISMSMGSEIVGNIKH